MNVINDENLIKLCSLATKTFNLPIRIFNLGNQIYNSIYIVTKDPMILEYENLLNTKDRFMYYSGKYSLNYGVINYQNYKIIMGPTNQIPYTQNDIIEIMRQLDIPFEERNSFETSLKACRNYSITDLFNSLSLLYYYITEDPLIVTEMILEQNQKETKEEIPSKEDSTFDHSKTYIAEQKVITCVQNGDEKSFKAFIASFPPVHGSTVANSQIRQNKNIFIGTATICSRAAINGGMSLKDAMDISGNYIQQCELLDDIVAIHSLQFKMVLDYIRKVADIRKTETNRLIRNVYSFVNNNLTKEFNTQDIADELKISRPYLSKVFKEETGITLSEYITKERIHEGERLLKYTDRSISYISSNLGFSSQSHFTRVFKQINGLTPLEYRKDIITPNK